MNSTEASTTSEAYDPCDYILCESNLPGTESTSGELRIKKCAGCSLARYCSKACQTSDWQNHRVWCRTHKANSPEDAENWRRLHRRLYTWRRTHFRALKDAFLASADLQNNHHVNRRIALGLFVSHKPHSAAPMCMHIQRIEPLSYASAEAHPYAAPRTEYEEQLAERSPTAFYGAGMVVVRIQHAADAGGETTYAVPIPITAAEASVSPADGWEELLVLRLLKGTYLDPDTDVRSHDLLVSMLNRNTARSLEPPRRWSWTRKDEEAMATAGTRNFTLNELLDSGFLKFFYESLTSFQRAAAVEILRDHIVQIILNCEQPSEDPNFIRCCLTFIGMLNLSRPIRLHEAGPSFGMLFAIPEAAAQMEANAYLMFMFVDSLASIPGKEDEALEAFDRVARIDPEDHEPALTTRGYISRMLRRIGRIAEAEEHEEKAARQISESLVRYTVPKVHELLRDHYNPHARNYILEHPLVLAWIASQADFIRSNVGTRSVVRRANTGFMGVSVRSGGSMLIF